MGFSTLRNGRSQLGRRWFFHKNKPPKFDYRYYHHGGLAGLVAILRISSQKLILTGVQAEKRGV